MTDLMLNPGWLVLFALAGCSADRDQGGDDLPADDPPREGLALLGWGTHTVDAVSLTSVFDSGLQGPRDIEFHPDLPWQAWVACADNDSIVIIDGLDADDPQGDRRKGDNAAHFLANPTALAFGPDGTMATAHDEDQITQPATPGDFMGPTLWPSAPDRFDGGHASHLDMLHNSPNAVGAASAGGNDFWMYDGSHGALVLYKFNDDHGEGGSDHSDGQVRRFLDGQLGYQEDTPSHLALDATTGLLYAADTERGEILVLDTLSGQAGPQITPNYDGARQRHWTDAASWVLEVSAEAGLEAPSGLEIHDDLLWITDTQTSRVLALTFDGAVVDWLDTGLPAGALMGFSFGPDGAMYIVDGSAEEILRLAPAAP